MGKKDAIPKHGMNHQKKKQPDAIAQHRIRRMLKDGALNRFKVSVSSIDHASHAIDYIVRDLVALHEAKEVGSQTIMARHLHTILNTVEPYCSTLQGVHCMPFARKRNVKPSEAVAVNGAES